MKLSLVAELTTSQANIFIVVLVTSLILNTASSLFFIEMLSNPIHSSPIQLQWLTVAITKLILQVSSSLEDFIGNLNMATYLLKFEDQFVG